MKKYFWLPPIMCILIAVAISIIALFYQPNKIVYISSKTVFEGFRMTKEIQKSASREAGVIRRNLDSINSKIASTQDRALLEALYSAALNQRNSLDLLEQNLGVTETKKVWDRIQGYAKLFAEEKGYDYILGAQPNANILYGNQENDVTTEFLQYLNDSYEGK